MNAPIDRVHADSIEAVERIRTWFAVLHAQATTWQPRPLPPEHAHGYRHLVARDGTTLDAAPVERPSNRAWFRSLW